MRILLPLLLVLALCGYPAVAQHLIIAQYNTDNGLPQNSVKDIAFDEWGFCWMATEMGLVRYDGQRFDIYGTSEIKGLISERMEGLTADARGTLYAKAYGGQILRIAATGKHVAPRPVLMPKWSAHVGQHGVVVGEKEMLKKLIFFYNRLGASPFLYSSSISDKEVYLRNQDSLLYVSPRRAKPLKIRTYTGRNPRYTILAGQLLVCILPGNHIEVWKNGRHLSAYGSIGGTLASDARFLAGDFLSFPAPDGFYVYVGENLHKVSLHNGRFQSAIELHHIRIPGLRSIRFVPAQGVYYLGSSTDGLFKVRRSPFVSPPFSSPILGQSTYAQADVGEGRFVVKNFLFSRDAPPRQLPIKNDISALLFTTADRQLYFAQDYMLRKLDIRSGNVLDVAQLEYGFVHMSPAGKGSYLFAQSSGFARLVNDKVLDFKQFPQKTRILFARQIRPSYFLVCTENGLKWYDYERNRIDKSVLDSMLIRTVYAEDDGKLWIATYGKGFYLFQNNKLYRMPLGMRQALKTVHSFIEDGQGFFWLPSNNGLFKVRKADLMAYAEGQLEEPYFFRFDRSDGLPTNEFNGGCDPSYLWLKDSLLSLPSMKGLVWFYPNRLKPYLPEKSIFTDSLTINNQLVAFNHTLISLPPDFKRLSVQLTSPYFGNSENLGLEYQVSGLDPYWHAVDKTGQLAINSLPAGDYKLIVRRSGEAGPKSPNKLVLPILVTPWFYNTWWFYLFCICCSMLIGYLLFQRRLTKLEREALALENTISNRTFELKNAVDDLAKSEMALLESNRFKDHVITMVLHDMRSPLRFISLISGKLLKNHTHLPPADLDTYLSDLHLGTQNLLGFTEQFFMWISAQREGFRVSKTVFSMKELFEEIASLYQELFKVNRNTLSIICADQQCFSDYRILSVVIRNLIDNANKNTYEGDISLSCREDGSRLRISISDTGQGLTDEQIGLFMSRDRQAGNRGTGSLLIHAMLDYIGGAISVTTEPGRGSTFTITLPNPDRSDIPGQDGSVPAGS
ncbi:ATP-binding protein [Dyadobacter sp. CY261]|uniref:sensor histidine kinase n=1 Tax=Dyadobacter sp. CY261 TaxID=2907203 RepID=UPI001F39F4B2|nr:ATP-binding protein [Dyadobacter sp. CY261]MCF0074073.1 ATP-binding protein [Dyadobacter sp. CY261]